MQNTAEQFALITGASEGLGKHLAFECAKRKTDMLLVALPGSGLPQLSKFIRENFDVNTYYFETDLSAEENCLALCAYVREHSFPVNILINNAGMGGTKTFAENDLLWFQKVIKVNVMATTILTHQLVEVLERNTPSYILNTSSFCTFFFLPFKQVYGATKAYIHYFSKSLRKELMGSNVHVSVLCPGGMNTTPKLILEHQDVGFFSRLSILDPEDVARYAIEKMLLGKELIIPGYVNQFYYFLDKILPEGLKKLLTGHAMNKVKTAGRPELLLTH